MQRLFEYRARVEKSSARDTGIPFAFARVESSTHDTPLLVSHMYCVRRVLLTKLLFVWMLVKESSIHSTPLRLCAC